MTDRNGVLDDTRSLVAPGAITAQGLEQVLIGGDLSKMSPADRVSYYEAVCKSIGLNPLTQPFMYITLNNKLTLYARRDATDQLRAVNKVSIVGLVRERLEDVYVVTATARTADGRSDESIGAVSTAGLRGEALANAMMKAETKAKRRVTLSIVGLGWLDETEIETIPNAVPESVNQDTGEIIDHPQIAAPKQPVAPIRQAELPTGQAVMSRAQKNARYDAMYQKAPALGITLKKREDTWAETYLDQEASTAANKIRTAEDNALRAIGQ